MLVKWSTPPGARTEDNAPAFCMRCSPDAVLPTTLSPQLITLSCASQSKGGVLAVKAADTRGKDGVSATRQRRCLSHEAGGNTRQRRCLTTSESMLPHSMSTEYVPDAISNPSTTSE